MALGYDIIFEFQPNPFFSNAVLVKRYLIDVLPDQCDYVIVPHRDVLATDCSGRGKGINKSKNQNSEILFAVAFKESVLHTCQPLHHSALMARTFSLIN